ncbi:MAG: DNA-J related domain-containing protein [Candidatus Brocadiia bacterium]
MSATTPDHALLAAVLDAVREQPRGQTEHTLLRRLADRNVAPFAGARLDQPLELFRAHFLLFHCLYRLRDQLVHRGEWLGIHCLEIALAPLEADPGTPGDGRTVAAADPLRSYYLDLGNLESMDAATVEAMLSDFWRRLDGSGRRREALRVLGLDDDADGQTVRRQYRRLAQRHHPDKGGDTETLQKINEAMMVLNP